MMRVTLSDGRVLDIPRAVEAAGGDAVNAFVAEAERPEAEEAAPVTFKTNNGDDV